MTAPLDSYQVASGQPIYGGKAAPAAPALARTFDTEPTYTASASDMPDGTTTGKPMIVSLHGSGGSISGGRQYTTECSGDMAFSGFTTFNFAVSKSYIKVQGVTQYHVRLRPHDRWTVNGVNRESNHVGFVRDDGLAYLISEHRYDALIPWAEKTLTEFNHKKRCLYGGSMGAWGTVTFGIPRAHLFAAIYPDRPRWRYGYDVGQVPYQQWGAGAKSSTVAASPLLAPQDGGGTYAAHIDMVAYISNPANKVPPVLWCIGRNDGYGTFEDSIAAVDALRATGRAFAFVWNDGDHGTGSIMNQIWDSYPFGLYELGKGYPLFTEHSGDQDPRVDLVGGINEGLTFKNVTETPSGWSCEVTSILGARTVKVKPVSDVFTSAVAAKLVTIPAANTWVLVEFN